MKVNVTITFQRNLDPELYRDSWNEQDDANEDEPVDPDFALERYNEQLEEADLGEEIDNGHFVVIQAQEA